MLRRRACQSILGGPRLRPCLATAIQMTTARRFKSEEEEEIEREKKMRERFQQSEQQKSSGGWGSWLKTPAEANNRWANFDYNTATPEQQGAYRAYKTAERIWLFLLYATAFYSGAVLYQLRDDQSPVSMMQGIPPWVAAPESLAYFALLRALASYREQGMVQGEYANYALSNGGTFHQFMSERHPTMFEGTRTRQIELVALLSAAYVQTGDLNFVPTMAKAVVARDRRQNVDSIGDAIRREYPNAIPAAAAFMQIPQQQQQQQYYPQPQFSGSYPPPGFYQPPPNQQQQYYAPPTSTPGDGKPAPAE